MAETPGKESTRTESEVREADGHLDAGQSGRVDYLDRQSRLDARIDAVRAVAADGIL